VILSELSLMIKYDWSILVNDKCDWLTPME